MPSRTTKLSVRDVRKSFGRGATAGHAVLGGVSFDVLEGEIVSLVGESGCGKTTLLRIIQGLLRMDAGAVWVDGEPVHRPGRDRGLVFQHPNLLPWRTARANIEFGLELAGANKVDRTARSTDLLRLVGLEGAAGRYPHQLSGGMQQRIGLARALAIDPQILLMDEPFSALDAQTREVLQGELLRVHGETSKTTLFVTHDLDEAIYLSDRIIALAANPGRVRRIIDVPFSRPRPPPPELRGDPAFQAIRAELWREVGPRAGEGA